VVDIDQGFLVHLVRLGLAGKGSDVGSLVRRALGNISKDDPGLAAVLMKLLASAPSSNVTQAVPMPSDADSRLLLLQEEQTVILGHMPVWPPSVGKPLQSVVRERGMVDALMQKGLLPTRTLLFTGAPGVGKTLAARWLAQELGYPLYVLDLAAVMSSYLGRTGTNVRAVLDYTRNRECVLLLDEFDSIAKRRDDMADIGELKRLVTVLLQAVDSWPSTGILVAATNHPDLLDPAAWRRFERVVEFPRPSEMEVRQYLAQVLAGIDNHLLDSLATVLVGSSFADLEHVANRVKRGSVVDQRTLSEEVMDIVAQHARSLTREQRAPARARLNPLDFQEHDK